MKKAKWLWILPTALALVFAFFLPRILLRFEEHKAEEMVETYAASNNVLNDGELSIVQKLSLLADGNYSTLVVDKGQSLLTDQEVSDAFFVELEKLYMCGALNEAFYHIMVDHFAEGLIITPFLVVDRIGNVAFQYYELYSYDGWGFAKFDPVEGKILHLVDQEDADLLFTQFLDIEEFREMNGADPMLEAMVRAWAEYFGLLAEKVTVCDGVQEKATEELNVYLSWCYLYDESGNRFAFALYYQTDFGVLQFGGISTSEAENLAAAAELDAIEEMTESAE